MLTNYLDWSDSSQDRFESGQAIDKFGDVDYCFDNETGICEIHLRRNTLKKKNFTLFLPDEILKSLYEDLKKRFDE